MLLEIRAFVVGVGVWLASPSALSSENRRMDEELTKVKDYSKKIETKLVHGAGGQVNPLSACTLALIHSPTTRPRQRNAPSAAADIVPFWLALAARCQPMFSFHICTNAPYSVP